MGNEFFRAAALPAPPSELVTISCITYSCYA